MESKNTISNENQKEVLEQTQEPVQKATEEEVEEQVSNPSSEKDWYKIVYFSVFGFFSAIAQLAGGALVMYGIYYGAMSGYNRWFDTDGLIEVGERGYCYDPDNECFVKPIPNRRVVKGCMDIEYRPGDTIGVAQVGVDEYRYINFNTLSFINDKKFYRADVFRNGLALALDEDSIYHISTTGKIISSEASTWIYASVEEISYSEEDVDSDGDIIYEEIATGLYKYEDVNGKYGLMSSDFVRLTQPLFSDIMAKSKDYFFCEYLDSGLGILVDKNGNILK